MFLKSIIGYKPQKTMKRLCEEFEFIQFRFVDNKVVFNSTRGLCRKSFCLSRVKTKKLFFPAENPCNSCFHDVENNEH